MREEGASLIELMIGLALLGLVLLVGMPSLKSWLTSTQVRSAAESILAGLQTARAEAIRRNTQAIFKLTSTTGVPDWSVLADDPTIAGINLNVPVQSWSGGQAKNAIVGTSSSATQNYSNAIAGGTGMPASVTFDSMGNVFNGGTDLTRIDVTNKADSSATRLVLVVSAFGQIRMCNPAVSLASNPEGCQ